MNIGIVGTGMMIREIMPVFESMPEINVAALYGRNLDVIKGFAENYTVGAIYNDYEEFLASKDFDVVYIALVNDLHYKFSLDAFNASKHVILEKPLTVNLEETLKLAKVANEKKLLFLEAITTIHLPNYQKMKQTLAEIAPIRLVLSNFSQYSSHYDEYLADIVIPSFDPKHYGGALTDMSIYNIHGIVGLFGKPDTVQYYDNKGFNGTDTSGTLIMQYDGFIANASAAKDSTSPNFFIVQGEKGSISMFGSPNSFNRLEISMRGQETEHLNLNGDTHRLAFEFLEFKRIYDSMDFTAMNRLLAHSIAVMEVLEKSVASH